MGRVRKLRGWWLLAMCMAPLAYADGLTTLEPRPRITVIIDDLGYSLRAGRRAVMLPGPVVCAVLPRTPRARALAELAQVNGKEVLLHLPLQAVGTHDGVAEPGGMTLDMSRRSFADTLSENFETVPFVVGVNGHKGSLLTRHPGHMRWLMDEIAERRLLFVDSYTTHLSVALKVANEAGVPATRRDVFLDASPEPSAIAREFARLKSLARAQGSAVGIGHPYASTLQFLETALPQLEAEGFELVGIRQLLSERGEARRARSEVRPRNAAEDSAEPSWNVSF